MRQLIYMRWRGACVVFACPRVPLRSAPPVIEISPSRRLYRPRNLHCLCHLMVSYTHITSCLRVINSFPFVPLLNHPRISPINSNLHIYIYWPHRLYSRLRWHIWSVAPGYIVFCCSVYRRIQIGMDTSSDIDRMHSLFALHYSLLIIDCLLFAVLYNL